MEQETLKGRFLSAVRGVRETLFGYDAVVASGKRRVSAPVIKNEDDELNGSQRRQMQAQASDVVRNFAIASWAVRKHLDFVSRFHFQSQTGNTELDRSIELMMEEWGSPGNCEETGRHDIHRFMRLFEARACVDGDVAAVMLRNGRLQAIEADRIRQPLGTTSSFFSPLDGAGDVSASPGWVHGVRCDKSGRAIEYAVWRRKNGGYEFERNVSAGNLIHHGYFDRFDQVRGITPMASGLNSLQDVYENFSYALAKAKISQIFGIAFYSERQQAAGIVEEEDGGEDGDEPRYKVNFGQGPVALELDPGDRAEIIESKEPSDQFQSFTQSVIQVSLKSLDLPLCFYDEAHTNFYGSRAAVILYIESCKSKRRNLRNCLDRITRWKIRQWIYEGRLVLPAGMTAENMPFEWIHAGLPWWDPSKDIAGDQKAIESCLRTRSEIRKERFGDDWRDVVERLAEEKKIIKELGLEETPGLNQQVPNGESNVPKN